MNRRSCRTHRIFACASSPSSQSHREKSVPPFATSNRPFFAAIADVKAPFTCPNSVDSNSSDGTAPVFTGTNGGSQAAVNAMTPSRSLLSGATACSKAVSRLGSLRDQIEQPQHRLARRRQYFQGCTASWRSFQLDELFLRAVTSNRRPNIRQRLLVVPRLLCEVLGTCR